VLLHLAAAYSAISRPHDALDVLTRFLALVEGGRLDIGGASPQKLCMTAVCYHNMAVSSKSRWANHFHSHDRVQVEHLRLRNLQLACECSQSALKLAQLCLSYSSRWLSSMERTHELVLEQLCAEYSTRVAHISPEEKQLFSTLTSQLYSPNT
jgi:hypothetical protein